METRGDTFAMRTVLRELVALSAIPAVWVGREPRAIATGLAEVLVGSLDLDVAFVRLRDPHGGDAIEATSGNGWDAFPEWLRAHLASAGPRARHEIVPGVDGVESWRGVVIPIGVDSEEGLVAAACRRPGFPGEIDHLLLSVAANQAAVAFQNARLRHEVDAKVAELRHAHETLELRVAERTEENSRLCRELEEREAALRRSEAYLAEGQRLTHTGSWAINIATRQALHSSDEHSRLFGFDPEDGMPAFGEFLQRVHPDDRDHVVEALDTAIRSGADLDMRYRIAIPGGPVRYMHAVGRPVVTSSGDMGEYVGIAIDVTERRRAEEERERLRQVQADLAHVARVTTMGELTASLGHEVNQPIAAALTDARTCLRWLSRAEPDVHEAREAASRIVKDVTRAADIVSRIRLLFKKGTPERALLDVNELAREMIVLLRGETSRYGVAVRTELAADLPQVLGDRVQLQQVIMNLVMNGVDAMKQADAPRTLTVASQRAHGDVLISVSDTGPGVPPEHADEIFTAFFTTKAHGTGMGLSISRSIVESCGGRLWATGNAARGATFHFTIPATAATLP